jgi:hypothetical protein
MGNYSHIEGTQEISTAGADRLLKEGWEILEIYKAKQKIGDDKEGWPIYSEKAICVMGKVKPATQLSGTTI